MKRKGRQHLPKVGSPEDLAWEHREGTHHLEHPLADDPAERRGPWAAILAVVVVLLLVLGFLGWLILT